jgi:hypothetical protein
MGLIDKLTSAGEQATASARESLHESQLRHDLAHAYGELGRLTYGLLEAGALADVRLVSGADAVRALERELAGLISPQPTLEG